MHHFRSSNLITIEKHLLACWEKCTKEKVNNTTRLYSSNGELVSIVGRECDSQQSSGDQNPMGANGYLCTGTTDSVYTTLEESQNQHPIDPTTPDTMSPPTRPPSTSVDQTSVDSNDSEFVLEADQHEIVLDNDHSSTTLKLQEIEEDFTMELQTIIYSIIQYPI